MDSKGVTFGENKEFYSDEDYRAEANDICDDDDDDIDELLYQFYKKQKIQHLKKKLSPYELSEIKKAASSLGEIKKAKGNESNHVPQVKRGFIPASPDYFSEVISSLSNEQQKVIHDYGFGSLLLYDRCTVPNQFILWLANHVDCRTSELIVNHKFISFNKLSVHKVLGLPIGGDPLISDCEAGKDFILSKFNLTKLPSLTFFGDNIKNNELLADDELFICFMIVALSCFLCPSSNSLPSTKYMSAFKDLSCVGNIDWSLYIYDWLIDFVRKLSGKSDRPMDSFGCCSYFLAVLYLDCLNFGAFDVPRQIPRIAVWKGSMIKFYSDLDELEDHHYGKRCFRDVIDTQYEKDVASPSDDNLYEPTIYTPSRSGFRTSLKTLFGHMLNTQIVDGICDIFDSYCSKIPRKQLELSQSLIFSMLKLFDDLTSDAKVQINDKTQDKANNTSSPLSTARVAVKSDFVKPILGEKSVDHNDEKILNCTKDVQLQNSEDIKENIVPSTSASKDVDVCQKVNSDCPQILSQASARKRSTRIPKSVSFASQNDGRRTNDGDLSCSKKVSHLSTPVLLRKRTSNLSPTIVSPDCYIVKNPKQAQKRSRGAMSIPFDIDKFEKLVDVADDDKKKLSIQESTPHLGIRNVDYVPNSVPSSQEAKPRHLFREREPTVSQKNTKTQMSYISLEEIQVEDSFKVDSFDSETSISDAINVKPKISVKSPDVVIVKERIFVDKLNTMCNASDKIYNKNIGHFKERNDHEGQELEDARICADDKDSSLMSFVNEDGVLSMADAAPIPTIGDNNSKFPVTAQERRNYTVVCRLASSSRHYLSDIIDIGGCKIKFFSLGDSMAPQGKVCSYVINCLCRKYFLDERPTISLKHYFFSSVSAVLMSDSDDYSYIQKCFNGAASVIPLPLCQSLFFPVLFGDHWFLFVVDLKNKYYLILDSCYSKDDEYTVNARRKLIPNFRRAWEMFVASDVEFHRFRIAYPHVPKQDNAHDCGIFVIKFMELWNFGSKLLQDFSREDIPNIRVQIVNDLLLSDHNKADIDIVTNFYGPGDFPRIGK